jgi:hypothetical protein
MPEGSASVPARPQPQQRRARRDGLQHERQHAGREMEPREERTSNGAPGHRLALAAALST